MGKKKSEAPPAPDPNKLISGQSQANEQTLAQNLAANRVDQVTPYGNITYTGDPLTGQTQTTTLTPGAQATLSNQEQLAQLLSGMGIDAASGVDLSAPDLSALPSRVTSLDVSGLPTLPGAADQAGERQRIESELFNRSKSLLDPVFSDQRRRTEQTLADRGFDLERSEGATREFDRLDTQQNLAFERAAADAVAAGGSELSRNFDLAQRGRSQGLAELLANAELANQGRESGLNEELALRALPLSDIGALASLTPDLPTLAPAAPYTNTQAPVDTGGLTLAQYQAALQKAGLDQQAKAGFWNNITGLATAGVGVI